MKDRAKITYRDKYGPAMEITDQAEADKYFEELVRHNLSFGENTRELAENVERHNLGYYAGYYDSETRERVERLFKCEHPVFGSIAQKGPPATEEALMAGFEAGLKARVGRRLKEKGLI
jgi:hypothetical protein